MKLIYTRPFFYIARPLTRGLSKSLNKYFSTDAFQLLPEEQKTGAFEDKLYAQQVKDVEEWWASPRYEGIKRSYTAQDVVSKRGSLIQSYPSSIMARKLFNLVKEREAAGQPIHTSEITFYLKISTNF